MESKPWIVWSRYESQAEALAAREAQYRELKAAGISCRRTTLNSQARYFASSETGDVYALNIDGAPEPSAHCAVSIR